MSNMHLPRWREAVEPVIYGAGVFVALCGGLLGYFLTLTGAISMAEAALTLTIAAAVGITTTTAGVLLRTHRADKELAGPLLFGAGLGVALIGSLASYTLFLYQAVSQVGAVVGVAIAVSLAVLLASGGVIRRVYYIEEQQVKRVVLKPFRLYPRDTRCREERGDD